MIDWVKAAGGRPPKFSEHSPAWFIRRSVPREIWDSYYKVTVERNSWDLAVSAFFWYRHYHDPNIDFDGFVRSEALKKYVNWPLYTINDEIVVDEVIRYEVLAESLTRLSKRLGLPELALPKAKSGLRRDCHYRDMYNDETRERVAALYSKEISHFVWKF